MKSVVAFALFLCLLSAGVTRADTSKHVVRIACVPEAGLLHVESADLHDSVASDPSGGTGRIASLTEAGFHDPHQLATSCVLGAATYLITATQDETSNYLCGGDPEVYLTVKRDGQPFLVGVVFGASCKQLPGVARLMVADGPASWRGRETQVCYTTGKAADPEVCDWTQGASARFNQRFPLDEARVQRIAIGQERR